MTNTSTETETEEWQRLRSQIVILKKARGTHRKYQPYAFTEHGIPMLSSVLTSEGTWLSPFRLRYYGTDEQESLTNSKSCQINKLAIGESFILYNRSLPNR